MSIVLKSNNSNFYVDSSLSAVHNGVHLILEVNFSPFVLQ